ncbi:MAG: glycerol-3-phosphate 1-O-acyltransferase PlsB [Steroidobacteraceae bacterium]
MLALLRWFLGTWTRPRVLPEDASERYGRSGRFVCYVMETHGVADLMVLQQVCEKSRLPPPSNPASALLTKRAAHLEARDGVWLFLEQRRGFWGDRIDRRSPAVLYDFVQRCGTDPQYEIEFVPVNVFWGRAPDKEASWLRVLLAENWDRAGRLRRMLSVLVNGRNLFVQFGDPVSLRDVVTSAPTSARAVRRLTRVLRTSLRTQRAAMIGPDLSHRRTIITQVLRTQAVRQAVVDEISARKLSRRQALEQAQSYAYEIAANYSPIFVALMARALTTLWNRLYDGVELHNLDNLHSIGEGNEIVFVPCHRSHMDYLLLSYIIYYNGYAVPHIAAGINLNMPGVGPFLRRGGAFFIRRSFRGNTLYTMVFMKYLGLMMARGHSIEYFIEGGRSRTGRLLQPKTGMLSMTVRSYLRDPRRPVVFLPVYFGYERLVEGKTYINELSGKPKEKESIFMMLRTLPALRQRFGKVHVSLGAPIHLDEVLARHRPAEAVNDRSDRPAWLNAAVDELAVRTMTNINSAAAVTPINLLALVLLATPKQSMMVSDLAQQLELYAALLRQEPYSPYVQVTTLDGASMIRHGEALGVLQRQTHALGDVVRMTEENSVLMTYFRNNVMHLAAMPSLMACCFLNNRTLSTRDIQRLAWRIYPYVRDELFLRWDESEIEQLVRSTLEGLCSHGLLERIAASDQWRRPDTGSRQAVQLSVLAQVTVQIIERYYLTISLLTNAGSGKMTQDALESQCQLMAQRMSLLYELNSPEFFDRSLFKNFIDLLRARNVIGVNADGKLTFTGETLAAIEGDAQLVLHEQIRNSVLQVTHR